MEPNNPRRVLLWEISECELGDDKNTGQEEAKDESLVGLDYLSIWGSDYS
jgi:hypothetical protein